MIEQLVEKITEANKAYRSGHPMMSDAKYDQLVEELELLDQHHPVLYEVGHKVTDETRKSKLPITMASMNKVKTVDALVDWCRSKSILETDEVIITPKFDGLSLCVNEVSNSAWTRGDGEYGQKSDEHYTLISNKSEKSKDPVKFSHTYGEVMIPKKVFMDKYSKEYANPRNLVAGLLNSKTPDEMLSDCQYVKYGAVMTHNFSKYFETKKDIIDELNRNQKMGVQHLVCNVYEITEKMLIDLFNTWSETFEIDGLIIEMNSLFRQEKLGRENSSNNPAFARAFKHASFEQSAETKITGITWNISKQGLLKPTLHIDPVKLDGVTISNVTGNNARFVKDLGIGIGAKVVVKRSGMVIPIIADVLETVEWVMPNVPDIDWNENGVELMTLNETDEQRFKQAVSFLGILGVENVGEGVVRQLWDAGFNSIEKLLRAKKSEMMKLPGFGERKSQLVHACIHDKMSNVTLSKLQHATGLFKGLGSKKLVLLEHFTDKPSVDDITSIEGFAETSAESYLNSIGAFNDFYETIKDIISIKKDTQVKEVTDELYGMSFVFSGVRRHDLEESILSKGGRVASGVSKNSTHLIMKSKGSGSSKEKKAVQLGQTIMTVEELENMLV